jgi:hypothetical protein
VCITTHENNVFTYLFPNLISSACAMPKNNLIYCQYRHFLDLIFLMDYELQSLHLFIATFPVTSMSHLTPSTFCRTLHRHLFVAPNTVTFLSHLTTLPFCRTLHRYLFVAPYTPGSLYLLPIAATTFTNTHTHTHIDKSSIQTAHKNTRGGVPLPPPQNNAKNTFTF